MIRSIAVTTDFSELSFQPFEAAVSMARKFGARLHILHVLPEPEIYAPWQLPADSPSERSKRVAGVRKKLEDLVEARGALSTVDVDSAVLCGACEEAVTEFQKRENIDLLLVASHGHAGMEHFSLGSFTARLLQFSSCPVLVYKTRQSPEMFPEGTFAPKRILVAHDFSTASRETLPLVREWAEAYSAEVKLVFVSDSFELSALVDVAMPMPPNDDLRSNAMRELEGIISSEWRGIRAEPVVCEGHPAVEILKEADGYGADLIVMGSRGLSPFGRLELGSVAERVVHGAGCPVLVVKAAV